jgi:hypothetical protein
MNENLSLRKYDEILSKELYFEKNKNSFEKFSALDIKFLSIFNFQIINQIKILTNNKNFFQSENFMNIEENESKYFILFLNFKSLSFFSVSMII